MVDFGLNLVVGIIFGGTRVGMDLGVNIDGSKWLFIFPMTKEAIPISTLIYAVMVFFLLVIPVTKLAIEAKKH